MEPTESQLQSFIALYRKELGISLTSDQAKKEIASLVFFVSLCIRPLAENDWRDINKEPNASYNL